MELRRLRLLDEFARRGTVAAVAEALSYSPSSVSVQLAELEREAGTRLLRRVGRNLELTAAGARLAEHAAQALTADEAVRAELANLGGAPRGRVRLTFVQTPGARAPERGAARRSRTPRRTCASRSCRSRPRPRSPSLRSRAVDVVVGVEYEPVPVPRHRDIDRRDLIREDVRMIVPSDHPLAARPRPDLARRGRARRLGRGLPRQRPQRRRRAPLQPLRRLRARHPPPHRRRPAAARAGRLRPGRHGPARADRDRHPAGRRAPDRRRRRAPHDLHRGAHRRGRRARRQGRPRQRCSTAAATATAGRDDVTPDLGVGFQACLRWGKGRWRRWAMRSRHRAMTGVRSRAVSCTSASAAFTARTRRCTTTAC